MILAALMIAFSISARAISASGSSKYAKVTIGAPRSFRDVEPVAIARRLHLSVDPVLHVSAPPLRDERSARTFVWIPR